MQKNHIQAQITDCISKMEDGCIFTIYDFISYGSYDTVKRTMLRIMRKGMIGRVMNGIYWKPLSGESSPDMAAVASAVAKKFNWCITPSRRRCLFILGLEEMDDDGLSFMSTGPARSYTVLGKTITFRHTLKKDIEGLSEKSGIVVETLRAVGKNAITPETLTIIRQHLSEDELEIAKRECSKATGWISEAVILMAGIKG